MTRILLLGSVALGGLFMAGSALAAPSKKSLSQAEAAKAQAEQASKAYQQNQSKIIQATSDDASDAMSSDSNNALPVAQSVSMPVPMQSSDTKLGNAGLKHTGMDGHRHPMDKAPLSKDVNCPEGSVDHNHLPAGLPHDLAVNARPGQCFTRLLTAPVLESYNDRELVSPARLDRHTIPAVREWREQQVLVTAARTESYTIPAVTHRVLETMVVRPASYREEIIPAIYETRSERVMVRPEHQEWVESEGVRTGAALVTPGEYEPAQYRENGVLTWPGKTDQDLHASAETRDYYRRGSSQIVYCLKWFPPEYRTESHRVVVRPEETRRVEIPAVTRDVERVVVDVPARVETREIPATYRLQKVQVTVAPERVETVEIPAVYKDVVRQRVVQDPQPVWAEILCERNATPAKIREIQEALTRKGYYHGRLTGRIDQGTVAAMQRFEADRGLPQGQISVDAVRALGVSL